MASNTALKDHDSDRRTKRAVATNLASTTHPAKYAGTSPVKVKKLGHLTFQVSDVERTVRFWTEVMGFEEVERNENGVVFFRFGPDHHSIGIAQGAAKQRAPVEDGLRTGHLAFEVENTDVLLAMGGKVSSDLLRILIARPKLFAELIRQIETLPEDAILHLVREVRDGDW